MKETRNCLFCQIKETHKIVSENLSAYAIYDRFPVTKGHVLVIPKRHFQDFFEITQEEFIAAFKLLEEMKSKLQSDDPLIDGFNIGINSGESAGQTIPHCHIHLIPRRTGDINSPRGGVRGVIPSKRIY
ncbi:HIT family protein [bacterium]|nr:HIT family protein [bacterium]